MNRGIAFFDFDKTIIKKDTLMPLALYIAKIRKDAFSFYRFLLYFSCYKLKLISNKKLKNIFLKLFFNGYSIEKLKDLFRGFEGSFIRNELNLKVYIEFERYIKSKYKVVIVSSNLKFMLENLRTLKGADIIATEVEYNNMHHSYKIKGEVCSDIEKLNKVRVLFGDKIFHEAVFYGDKEDKLLLSSFKKSFEV